MNARSNVGLSLLVIGLILCGGGLWLLLSPPEYQAIVKIQIESDYPSDGSYYDPYFIETELKEIYSDRVLSDVIQSLDLDEKWENRYGHGTKIKTYATILLLQHRMSVNADRNTKIIEVGVMDEDPNEAAQIANAIVDAYRDYRVALHKQQIAAGIKVLEKDYQDTETKIKALQAQVEQLGKPTGQTNGVADFEARQRLQDEEVLQEALKSKIQSEKADDTIPQQSPVAIIEPAVPPKDPMAPGRPYGIFLLVCGLVMSSVGLYFLARGSKTPVIPSNNP
jgi:uncharacterized protein involved in exopolysaccharide biosynthesis